MSYIVLVICVLVSVAFFTLLERSGLGYIQVRSGPNKVGVLGIPQPFADAISLFLSESKSPLLTNYYPYYFCPVLALFVSLVVWVVFPFETMAIGFELGVLFFLCCMSLGVYSVLGAGWASNSKYALLGGLRAVAQTISYEVSLALILLSFVFLVEGYDLCLFSVYQGGLWFLFISFPLMLAWFASCLAETNRTPFDFAEGESELVSGFNVEYGSGGFALIFMAEYASILFMGFLFAVVFLGGCSADIWFYFSVVFVAFAFIWVRGTLPRFRYDKLMGLAWSEFLPLSLNYLFFFVGLSILFYVIMLMCSMI
uniref:NADH-ubiquinone oxidoreductase chain 1 n=1 Tax=Occasjapyx japonicus TaxID=289462 RepID=U3KTI8_9HEXA|nr:NADH dehydrogenase subunit 1 [Occasjapyx japonicus]AEV44872.1 NADH dehydrogenase subunit 1 [Occasjapyx japonicus]